MTDAGDAARTRRLRELLTPDDVDQIIEGIDHFIVANDPDVLEVWQPYIDKLKSLRAVLDTEGDRPMQEPFREAVQRLVEYSGPLSITGRPANPQTELVVNREWFERVVGVLVQAKNWLRLRADTEGDQPTPQFITVEVGQQFTVNGSPLAVTADGDLTQSDNVENLERAAAPEGDTRPTAGFLKVEISYGARRHLVIEHADMGHEPAIVEKIYDATMSFIGDADTRRPAVAEGRVPPARS